MDIKKETFTQAQCVAFVDAANPHQWYLTAENLQSQAGALWANRGTGQLTDVKIGGEAVTWDNTNGAVFS